MYIMLVIILRQTTKQSSKSLFRVWAAFLTAFMSSVWMGQGWEGSLNLDTDLQVPLFPLLPLPAPTPGLCRKIG